MITHSTTDDNMTMTVIKNDSHKSSYATDTYTLRNRKGEYVGTLCVTASGVVTLCSSSGYKFADAPD